MSFNGRGTSYENRREGDRIIQDLNAPIRHNQYNAYAYSPDTFTPVSGAQGAVAPPRPPTAEPAPSAPPAPPAAVPARTQSAVTGPVKEGVQMPMPSPHPNRVSKPKLSHQPVAVPRHAALSRADATPQHAARPPQRLLRQPLR